MAAQRNFANEGADWDEPQDIWLWNKVAEKGPDYCARKMQRSVADIRMRLSALAKTRIAANQLTISDAVRHTRLPPRLLTPPLTAQETLDTLHSGASVFLTGAAGTGKTTILRQYIAETSKTVGVCAMTGCAALLMGGRTLHSFLAIGLATESARDLARNAVYKYKTRAERIRSIDALVIDEISMCSAELLDKVDEYLQILRRDASPFGGLQMIFVGDFCQLPPVRATYAFKAASWRRAAPKVLHLTTNYRQNTDALFQDILERARFGEVTADDANILAATVNNQFPEGIEPTRLYSLNRDVDRINQESLDALPGPRVTYGTMYHGTQARSKAWATSMGIPDTVTLCVGAQVMTTVNLDLDLGLANGSRGVITSLHEGYANVKFINGEEHPIGYYRAYLEEDNKVSASYMPLRLAFAISIHKSQGMTLDAVEMDLGRSIFENGQAYTALSRARNLNSIRVIDVVRWAFKTDSEVAEIYKGTSEL